jgi:hypothetical protein
LAWVIVSGPREYPAYGVDPDTVRGWAYDVERGEQRRTVKVELSALAVDESSVTDEGLHQAIRTQGRSAVEAFLDLDLVPARLVISTHGIGAPDDDADDLLAGR